MKLNTFRNLGIGALMAATLGMAGFAPAQNARRDLHFQMRRARMLKADIAADRAAGRWRQARQTEADLRATRAQIRHDKAVLGMG